MKLTILFFLTVTALIMTLSYGFSNHTRAWPAASRILVPPPFYDPWRRNNGYRGVLTVYIVPHANVYSKCRSLAANPDNIGPYVLACAIRNANRTRCSIVLPAKMPADLYKAVRRHEVAHCKGWVHKNTTGGTENMQLLEPEFYHE